MRRWFSPRMLAIALFVATATTAAGPWLIQVTNPWVKLGLSAAATTISMAIAWMWRKRYRRNGSQALKPEMGIPVQRAAPDAVVAPETELTAEFLPADLVIPPQSHFRGREAELTELVELHDKLQQRLLGPGAKPGDGGRPLFLLINGKAGVGKTAIGQKLARKLSQRYDGLLYANLGYAGDAASSSEVLRTFLEQMGRREDIPDEPEQRLTMFRRLIEDRRVLILLDAVRGPWQINDLLPSRLDCTVIITSRRDLGPEFGFRSHQLDALIDDDAIAMLYAVSQKDESSYPMSASVISSLCGGLPRALNIVGGWVLSDGRDLEDAANWLSTNETDRLDRLVGPLDNVQEGFAVEYDELDATQKRALCLASLIRATRFGPNTIARLIDCPPDEAEALCGALKAAQFFDPDDADQELMYRLHPLVRLFASIRLKAEFAKEEAPARRRLDDAMAEHVRTVARCMELPRGDDTIEASALAAAENPYRWLCGNLGEVARGLGRMHVAGDDVRHLSRILCCAPGLLCFGCDHGDLTELITKAAAQADERSQAELLMAQGAALISVENYVYAMDTLGRAERAVAASRSSGDDHARLLSALERHRAQAYAQMRSPRQADIHFHNAKEHLAVLPAEQADPELRVLKLLEYLSHGANLPNPNYPPDEFDENIRFWIYLERHEEYRHKKLWEEALEELDRAQECCSGDLRREANLLYRRARLHLENSEAASDQMHRKLADLAVRRSADTVHRFVRMSNPVGEVRASCLLVRSLAAAGRLNEAAFQLDEAHRVYEDRAKAVAGPAIQPLLARLTAAKGELLSAQGERAAAAAEFRSAANLFAQLNDGRSKQRYLNRIPVRLSAAQPGR